MNKPLKLLNSLKNKKILGLIILLSVLVVGLSSYAIIHSFSTSSSEKTASRTSVPGSVINSGADQQDIATTSSQPTDNNGLTKTETAATSGKSTTQSSQPSPAQSSQPASANLSNSGSKDISSNGSNITSPSETFPNSSFTVSKGGTSKAYGTSTITYTFTILISPTYAKFGNPTINARLSGSPGSDNYVCQNRGSVVSKTFDASRSISINCVVTRVYPSEPGQSPAPLQSQALVRIYVDGQTSSGVATNGGLIEYILDYGYDR